MSGWFHFQCVFNHVVIVFCERNQCKKSYVPFQIQINTPTVNTDILIRKNRSAPIKPFAECHSNSNRMRRSKHQSFFEIKSWQPVSLAKKPKIGSYFWIHEFRNKDHFNIKVFCQTGRLTGFHFEKPQLPK